MNANEIIEDYVNQVAAKLPRRLRNDIGLELRTLLGEQVRTAAEQAGRAPDGEMTLQLLRQFGAPDEVAARYVTPGFELIDPALAPLFVKLALLCVGVQWAVTLPGVFSSPMRFEDWWLRWGFSAFSWVGALVVWFAIGSWNRRRSAAASDRLLPFWQMIFWLPGPREWRPGEPQATERRAARNAAPLGAVVTVFFMAPAWILGHLLPAGTDTSWALYDEHFQHWLLLPLIGLLGVRLVLLAAATLNTKLSAPTESLRFGLWVCSIALLYWALFSGRIFAHPVTDLLVKGWLLAFLIINTIQIIVWLRRSAMRVRVPKVLV